MSGIFFSGRVLSSSFLKVDLLWKQQQQSNLQIERWNAKLAYTGLDLNKNCIQTKKRCVQTLSRNFFFINSSVLPTWKLNCKYAAGRLNKTWWTIYYHCVRERAIWNEFFFSGVKTLDYFVLTSKNNKNEKNENSATAFFHVWKTVSDRNKKRGKKRFYLNKYLEALWFCRTVLFTILLTVFLTMLLTLQNCNWTIFLTVRVDGVFGLLWFDRYIWLKNLVDDKRMSHSTTFEH